jgi:hypothetical protein
MIIFFKVAFNLVLSISRTHVIVKLETFPHLRRARAGSGWGRGAVRPPPNTSLKVPKYPAAVAWLLDSYATDAAIDAAAEKFLTDKQQAREGEDAFATRLRRYAAEAGNVYKEGSVVSRYLAGLAPHTANTIHGHVSPRMRFTQVKNLAIQAGL